LDADFGFTGHYVHVASGLHLALFRAYDADLGRWLSRDPIEEQGGINLYAYVHGNPIFWFDPLGLRVNLILLNKAKDGQRYNTLEKIEPKADEYSVGAHGDRNSVNDDRTRWPVRLMPEELAKMIIKDRNYKKGMKIRLYSCEVGDGLDSFAAKLRDLLQVEVIAPDRVLVIDHETLKETIIGKTWLWERPDPSNPGSWKHFYPTK
jgi:RHS repeat-associated protein